MTRERTLAGLSINRNHPRLPQLDRVSERHHRGLGRGFGVAISVEVVPGLVELEVAVPRLSPAVR
jgi:hypothetical protein